MSEDHIPWYLYPPVFVGAVISVLLYGDPIKEIPPNVEENEDFKHFTKKLEQKGYNKEDTNYWLNKYLKDPQKACERLGIKSIHLE